MTVSNYVINSVYINIFYLGYKNSRNPITGLDRP
jgi:hypothetical protein